MPRSLGPSTQNMLASNGIVHDSRVVGIVRMLRPLIDLSRTGVHIPPLNMWSVGKRDAGPQEMG
jgi:hypothetical protein